MLSPSHLEAPKILIAKLKIKETDKKAFMKSLSRLYLIDISRGLASFAVVLWHYQHFYFDRHFAGIIDRSALPFYKFLRPFFEHGLEGVQFFFVISGFIFFHRYFDEIRFRKITGSDFFIRRFSRLYPLHLITLIAVTVSQYLALAWIGGYFVYTHNDLKHFILNLFMVSHWGIQTGYSFNGPSWSISVEALLYILFFYFAAYMSRFRYGLLGMIALGYAIWNSSKNYSDLGLAVSCFFMGGATFLLYEKLRSHPQLDKWKNLLIALGCLCSALVIQYFDLLSLIENYRAVERYLIVFPAIIYVLASLQDIHERYGFSFRIIGDITYSTYMIHFPLQLFIIILVSKMKVTVDYYHSAVFLSYLSALTVLAVLTYFFIERPAQNYLRRNFRA